MKKITFVSPTFNEVANIDELYRRVSAVWLLYPQYEFEYLIIDNASTDGTESKLRKIAQEDSRVKVILNTRNFGHIRSPYWGLIQAQGDAIIYLASDLQDPPEMTGQFIEDWELGWKLVLAVKPISQENKIMNLCRKAYYRALNSISEVPLANDTTGFGLYDKDILKIIQKIGDPYPYLRGLVCELGFPMKLVPFNQPRRERGISKNNLYSLLDIGALGVISHSMVPLRFATFIGSIVGVISFMTGIIYLIAKIIFWEKFAFGLAPVIIGIFLMFGLIFLFIGILGEYIGSIHRRIQNRPIVVESERINF